MIRKRPKFLATGIRTWLLRSLGLPENERVPAAMILSLLVACVVVLTVSATLGAFVYTYRAQQDLLALRTESRDVRSVQLALLDIESGARGYTLSSRPDYLQPYSVGSQALDDNRATLGKLDRFTAELSGSALGTQTVSSLIAHLRSELSKLISAAQRGSASGTEQLAHLDRTKATMDTLRQIIGQFLAARAGEATRAEDNVAVLQRLLLALQIISGVAILTALFLAFRGVVSQSRARAAAMGEAVQNRDQIGHLLSMADMLQSAMGYEDANAVLRATAGRLLSGFGGALYIFNNSRDRLDLSTAWNVDGAEMSHPQVISPSQCWALKRGKPHTNCAIYGALRCSHTLDGQSALEIPMLARGEVYGLLQIFSDDPTGADLETIKPLAIALADSMSLALSSIALRERLRNQALRDPLTGLYNRRFMEEVLESFVLQAERRNAPMSAIMIDLDHFKKLNDQHGHAVGDAVLRDVAAAIMSELRKSDIACRYGGEELIVLLPDSDLVTARTKAEEIRNRIADVSPVEGVAVSASLGVASIPQTSASPADLLTMADAALYKAKQEGRNRVETAPARMTLVKP
ncbi:diguanylate cyclase [Microvirga lotononidis]|uniref:diguanylate cyclase n=1 Tax=Microvirga lotononidis TaxID=864069 RepID=I4YRH6_9HYPH|nr:diguanylate cyclase [Microvirga lotononidis]EIM26568.1 diguanylate cyclase (GGDEF) domain-containing protein [Microvirga lotononidis]WQO31248.1 diguanylate cyclase [Microvirga lotononidis]